MELLNRGREFEPAPRVFPINGCRDFLTSVPNAVAPQTRRARSVVHDLVLLRNCRRAMTVHLAQAGSFINH